MLRLSTQRQHPQCPTYSNQKYTHNKQPQPKQNLTVVRQDLGAHIGPCHTTQPTNSEPGSKVAPAIGRLQRIGGHGATRKGLNTDGGGFGLEGDGPVHGEGEGEDGNNASRGQRAGNFGNAFDVAEGPVLDEGAGDEESVGKADFNTAEEGGDTGAVGGEVGEVRGDEGRGGDGGFEHADEGIAVDGLDYLQKDGGEWGEGRVSGLGGRRRVDRGAGNETFGNALSCGKNTSPRDNFLCDQPSVMSIIQNQSGFVVNSSP